MNLLLFTPEQRQSDGRIHIAGRQLQQMLSSRQWQAGDTLRVGELGGLMGRGELISVDAESAHLDVQLDQTPPAKQPIQIVLALPRPKMLRRILRAVAEFGIEELYLINSYRVEKSYWQSPLLSASRQREQLLLGLEQSRDTILPRVHCEQRFKPFVEDRLPQLLRRRRALLAHPGTHPPCPLGPGGDTTVIIGPEGGFTGYEVEKLTAAGSTTVSLGPRILRVENALLSVLGRLA